MKCRRQLEQPIFAKINWKYGTSEPEIYVVGIGILRRTGVCSYCDAAIYRKNWLGDNVGPLYHAGEKGLSEIKKDS